MRTREKKENFCLSAVRKLSFSALVCIKQLAGFSNSRTPQTILELSQTEQDSLLPSAVSAFGSASSSVPLPAARATAAPTGRSSSTAAFPTPRPPAPVPAGALSAPGPSRAALPAPASLPRASRPRSSPSATWDNKYEFMMGHGDRAMRKFTRS